MNWWLDFASTLWSTGACPSQCRLADNTHRNYNFTLRYPFLRDKRKDNNRLLNYLH